MPRKQTKEQTAEMNRRMAEKFAEPLPMPGYEPLKSEPWLKWPQESDAQHAMFVVYRDMDPRVRSLSRTAYIRRFGQPDPSESRNAISSKVNPTGRLTAWNRHFRWRDRVDAFDREMERRRIAEMQKGQLEAYREMGERHAREAVALQAKAVARLQNLNPNELSAAEVRQFIVAAATLERMSRGASLQDMASAQRESVAQGRQVVSAQIEYVDDWRGDRERLERLRSQNSRYGNGQGLLPQDIEDGTGVTPVRVDGSPVEGEGRAWLDDQLGDDPLPVPEAPRRADTGTPG